MGTLSSFYNDLSSVFKDVVPCRDFIWTSVPSRIWSSAKLSKSILRGAINQKNSQNSVYLLCPNSVKVASEVHL